MRITGEYTIARVRNHSKAFGKLLQELYNVHVCVCNLWCNTKIKQINIKIMDRNKNLNNRLFCKYRITFFNK